MRGRKPLPKNRTTLGGGILDDNSGMDELHVFGASGVVGSFLLQRLQSESAQAIAWSHRSVAPLDEMGSAHEWRQLDLWRDATASSASQIISAGPLDAFSSWLMRVDTPKLHRVVALSSTSIDNKEDSVDPGERALALRLRDAEMQLRNTCAARGIAWTILRPTLIWGAGRDVSLTPLYRFARRFGFVPVPTAIGGLRQPVHAIDVANACVVALHARDSVGAVIALGGNERLAVSEMWSRVAFAAQARRLSLPIWMLHAGSRALGQRGPALRVALQRWFNDQIADTTSAAERLPGWSPLGFAPASADFELRAMQDAAH